MNEFDERRELRRQRRKRNQLISYMVIIVLLAGIVGGSYFGISKIVNNVKDKKQAEELAAQLEEMSTQETEPVAIEAPEATTAPEEDSALTQAVEAQLGQMSLEDKVAGLFIITPEELTGTQTVIKAGTTTQEKLTQYPVGGLVYFAKNIEDKDQLTQMLSGVQEMSKYPLFLAVDEEGGDVARVADSGIGYDNVGTMEDIGASEDTEQATQAGATIGNYLYELGFNLDFAPVADVAGSDDSIIKTRSFGSNAGLVGTMVAAEVTAMQNTGVSACLKHFPGLGDTTDDTHEGMVSADKTLEELQENDFLPFYAGIEAGADFIMVSHLSLPGVIGDNTPSSLSSVMIQDNLRNTMGYEGIVITDALNMTAITDYYSSGDAALAAFQAGADMILMPENFEEACQAILAAVNDGTISEERLNESLTRIYKVKLKGQAGTVDETLTEDTGNAEDTGDEVQTDDNADANTDTDSTQE